MSIQSKTKDESARGSKKIHTKMNEIVKFACLGLLRLIDGFSNALVCRGQISSYGDADDLCRKLSRGEKAPQRRPSHEDSSKPLLGFNLSILTFKHSMLFSSFLRKYSLWQRSRGFQIVSVAEIIAKFIQTLTTYHSVA